MQATSKGSDQTAHMHRCWSHIPHCWKSHVTGSFSLNLGTLGRSEKAMESVGTIGCDDAILVGICLCLKICRKMLILIDRFCSNRVGIVTETRYMSILCIYLSFWEHWAQNLPSICTSLKISNGMDFAALFQCFFNALHTG